MDDTGSSSWTPAQEAPASGLPAWDHPDAASPVVARLDPGRAVEVLPDRPDTPDPGTWVRVRTENGWEGWIDGSRLRPLGTFAAEGGAPPSADHAPPPATAGAALTTAPLPPTTKALETRNRTSVRPWVLVLLVVVVVVAVAVVVLNGS